MYVFVVKQKTAYEMRISDWSSDVCSSDLSPRNGPMITLNFLLTSLVVVLIPGTGVLFTISTGLRLGRRASVFAALGCTAEIVPQLLATVRSDERREGKAWISPCRSWWSPTHSKKNQL